jgi:hypothetical protein
VAAIEVVEPLPFVDGIVYGEGPRWHNGRLWFSDGPANKVYSVGESGDLTVEAEVAHASGLGWLPAYQVEPDGSLGTPSLSRSTVDGRSHPPSAEPTAARCTW